MDAIYVRAGTKQYSKTTSFKGFDSIAHFILTVHAAYAVHTTASGGPFPQKLFYRRWRQFLSFRSGGLKGDEEGVSGEALAAFECRGPALRCKEAFACLEKEKSSSPGWPSLLVLFTVETPWVLHGVFPADKLRCCSGASRCVGGLPGMCEVDAGIIRNGTGSVYVSPFSPRL